MTIQVSGAGVELTEGLRAWAARRVALALGRFASRVRRVTIRFSPPREAVGPAARCRVVVALGGAAPVVAERIGACVHAALEEAAEAAGRGLGRRLVAERVFGMEH